MKTALIIVDLQNDFCPNGALPVKDGDLIVPIINKIMEKFDIVVATKDWHSRDTEHFNTWPVHCIKNSFGAEFHPKLKIDKIKKIFLKGTSLKDNGYSGFESTNDNLGQFLKDNNVAKVYIVGLALDYCVKATAIDAHKLGFNTYIILDATKPVTSNKDEIMTLISELKSYGINIINSEEIFDSNTKIQKQA